MKYLISYKLFEGLQTKELQNNLYDLTDRLLKDGVLVKAYVHENGTIILMDLKSTQKGMGTKGMEALSKFADTHNLPIMTVASTAYGSDIERLSKFYNRFGFKYVKDIPGLNGIEMRRYPNHNEKIVIPVEVGDILEYNEFFEKITIDVGVGDIIYQGRFKNKKTVIKEIGEDETGMPTINKKKVVTFRIAPPKKNPNFKGYNRWKKKKKKED